LSMAGSGDLQPGIFTKRNLPTGKAAKANSYLFTASPDIATGG